MSITCFNLVDNNIISIILMLLVISNIHTGKRNRSYTAKIMLLMCWSAIAVLTADMMAWIVLEIQGTFRWTLVYFFNFLLFLLTPLVPVLWFIYCYVNMNNKHLAKKEILVFSIPLIINTSLMILTVFTGFIFSVDTLGQYHRGPGVALVTLLDFIPLMAAFYYALTHRNSISKRLMAIVVAFSVLPIGGSLLQLFFYGISISWPSIALGILLTYVFMEVQKNVRDHLTGLVNRQQYEEIILNRLSGKKSSRKSTFSLIVIDMNWFKEINDTHGHEAGDRALQEAAILLSRSVNIKDTVARLGGDEFVIILEDSDKKVAEKVIGRIREHLDQWNTDSSDPFTLSMSIGYAVYNENKHLIYKELFKEADEMMYRDKRKIKSQRSEQVFPLR